MIAITDSQTTWFDVDDTLLMWHWPEDGNVEEWLMLDPWEDGDLVKVAVNTAMVEQLKTHASRGHPIIVWSAGGGKWALTAVKALKLEKYVTLVIEKPTWAYDDKQAKDFITTKWIGKKEWLK